MARLVDRLQTKPDSQVHIVTGADDVCSACSHLEEGECGRFGSKALEIDDKLNNRLGLATGDVEPWSVLVASVRETIAPDRMFEYCGHCSWSDLNYCTDGIAALTSGKAADGGPRASR